MKTPTFFLTALVCLCFCSCNKDREIAKAQDPGDQQLGATVEAILEEENVKEAIWNPENMDSRNWPTIEVQDEKELREVIKSMHEYAQKMNRNFQQINQVNHQRYEAYSQQLADCRNRKDSLQVAMKYPDIVHLRDSSEMLAFGLVPKK